MTIDPKARLKELGWGITLTHRYPVPATSAPYDGGTIVPEVHYHWEVRGQMLQAPHAKGVGITEEDALSSLLSAVLAMVESEHRAEALVAAGNALATAYAEARNLARCEGAPCEQCKHVDCTSYAAVKAWREAVA